MAHSYAHSYTWYNSKHSGFTVQQDNLGEQSLQIIVTTYTLGYFYKETLLF